MLKDKCIFIIILIRIRVYSKRVLQRKKKKKIKNDFAFFVNILKILSLKCNLRKKPMIISKIKVQILHNNEPS